MSFWAYSDILRTNSITAEEAKNANKDTNYLCPNRKCPAIMRISHCDGVSKARFRSLPSHPHIKNCMYQRGGYQKSEFNEEFFDFDSAIEMLMSVHDAPTFNLGKQPPRRTTFNHSINHELKVLSTLSEIYNVLKSETVDAHYNGVPVKTMLADKRSAFFYTKGIWGYKIVETEYIRYRRDYKCPDEIKYVIYLQYPYSTIPHRIMLTFEDSKLSKRMQNLLYNNKDKKIIVATYFYTNKDKNGEVQISATITSERQIIII